MVGNFIVQLSKVVGNFIVALSKVVGNFTALVGNS
jgi:hypothetical protein